MSFIYQWMQRVAREKYSPGDQTFDPEDFDLYIVFEVKILEGKTSLRITLIFTPTRKYRNPARKEMSEFNTFIKLEVKF